MRSRRVGSTHASRGRVSKRSEIPSNGELLGCGFANSWAAAAGFATAVAALLGATVDLGSTFPGFASLLVVVTLGFLPDSVIGLEVGLWVGEGTLALMTTCR
jgi:hypothetical protein